MKNTVARAKSNAHQMMLSHRALISGVLVGAGTLANVMVLVAIFVDQAAASAGFELITTEGWSNLASVAVLGHLVALAGGYAALRGRLVRVKNTEVGK